MADQTTPVRLGVIGGSGLYEIEGLSEVERIHVRSPFGTPSDSLLLGRLADTEMVFLPRHGRGHPLPPSAVNYRANIDALKRAGVTDIVSLSAVGSLREDIAPGDFVLVDQFIDRTFAREKSFFGAGLAAHVSMAEPVCPAPWRPTAGSRGEPRPQYRARRHLPRNGRDRSSRRSPNRSFTGSGAARSSA